MNSTRQRLLNAQHLSLSDQTALLAEWVPTIKGIPDILEAIQLLPEAWVGAGIIYQNVWNVLHGFEQNAFIKDIDILYWDANDLSWEAEDRYIRLLSRKLSGLNLPIDVKNIARVHLWYEQRFGVAIASYGSVPQSIATWPVLGACMAMRQRNQQIEFIAPYGFQDMFVMRLRPNKGLISRDVYEEKVHRWTTQWPLLVADEW